jgi:hypothetical protein
MGERTSEERENEVRVLDLPPNLSENSKMIIKIATIKNILIQFIDTFYLLETFGLLVGGLLIIVIFTLMFVYPMELFHIICNINRVHRIIGLWCNW